MIEDKSMTVVADGAASAGTAVNGTTIDTSDCEGVIFMGRIATANAGNFIKVQEGDTTSPTTDLAGSAAIATVDGQLIQITVHKPLKRYLRTVTIRAGANTATGDVIAVKYGIKKLAADGAAVDKYLVSPIAGTA